MADENGGLSQYVVMAKDESGYWREVRTVKVPPRTKRKTILEKAVLGNPEAGVYRVLDEESARTMEIALEDQPPKVVIR